MVNLNKRQRQHVPTPWSSRELSFPRRSLRRLQRQSNRCCLFTTVFVCGSCLMWGGLFSRTRFLADPSKHSASTMTLGPFIEKVAESTTLDLRTSNGTVAHRLAHPTIHVLGERHSGTKWITEHLSNCFNHSAVIYNDLTRWKHWFQEAGSYHVRLGNKSVVVVQFRHILQWVKAMQFDPYHSPNHFNLSWSDYVHRPWTMPRPDDDVVVDGNATLCQSNFRSNQVIPCSKVDPIRVHNDRVVRPCYELKNDGSGQPYPSVLDLRSDKVRNFLSIANFPGIDAFHAVQYEEMVEKGTERLIRAIEKDVGVKARCSPSEPNILPARPLPYRYVEWMGEHADWDTEGLLGYKFEWDQNKHAIEYQEYKAADGAS